jgi:hypothetical protein
METEQNKIMNKQHWGGGFFSPPFLHVTTLLQNAFLMQYVDCYIYIIWS